MSEPLREASVAGDKEPEQPGCAGAAQRERGTVLLELTMALETHGIPYCLLGDTRRLPEEIPGDVDIVVAPDCLAQMPALLMELEARGGARLVQVMQHELTGYYFVLAWTGRRGGAGVPASGHLRRLLPSGPVLLEGGGITGRPAAGAGCARPAQRVSGGGSRREFHLLPDQEN